MPLSIKITPYEQTLKVLLDQTMSPEARNKMIGTAARQIITQADEKNRQAFGAVPPKKITVNGRQDSGELLHVVPPDSGTIIAEYRLIDDVLAWIMTELQKRSPVVSGDYVRSHTLLADDQVANPNNPPMASSYVFYNPVPYARRLEVGKTKTGRDFLISVPNMIYKRTADDAKAQFGNMAKIRAGTFTADNAYQLIQDQPSRSFTRGFRRVSARQRPDRVAGSTVAVPAIYVTIG